MQEPWCFAPDVVAGLTMWQAEWAYLRPAAERAKDPADKDAGGGMAGWNWDRDGVPPRERFVPAAVAEWGMSEAEAVAVWERAIAAEKKAKGG